MKEISNDRLTKQYAICRRDTVPTAPNFFHYRKHSVTIPLLHPDLLYVSTVMR